jgi:hypothetical protein
MPHPEISPSRPLQRVLAAKAAPAASFLMTPPTNVGRTAESGMKVFSLTEREVF